MRFAVTGAAGFIGSHLAEALQARARGRRDRLVHRLLRPGAEGAERARVSTFAASTSPRTSSTSPASTASSTSPASRASAASATSSRSTSSGTCSRASASSRRRRPPARASSSPRPPRSTARPSATRRPRTCRRVRSRRTGSRSSPASTSRGRTRRSFGLDAVVLRYFNAYGPRQRPDMAFPRILDALASGEPFALFGDGEQSRSFTYVADVVAATVLAMERAPPARPTTSAAARRRR